MKLLKIRDKVDELCYHYSQNRGQYTSLRKLCELEKINYNSINNALQKKVIGLKLVNQFKQIFPNLNINWLLYDEGEMMLKTNQNILKIAR